MKKKYKIVSAVVMSMVLMICMLSTERVKAADRVTTSWSVYYNQEGPYAENLITWSRNMIAHKATSKIEIKNNATNTKIIPKVLNYFNTDGSFKISNTGVTYDMKTLPVGVSCTYTVRISSCNASYITTSGIIKH